MTKISASLAVLCLAALVGATDATAAPTVTKFSFTGSEQSFTVPAGVTSMHVVAIGGRGGKGAGNVTGGGFGFGSVVSADVAVTPGDVVKVVVGGNGGDAVGATGGTGGFSGSVGSGGDGGSAKTSTIQKGGGGGGGMSYAYVDGQGILPGFLVGAAGGGGGGGGAVAGVGGNGSPDDGFNGEAGGNGAPTHAVQGGTGGGGGTASGAGKPNGKFFGGGAGTFGFADNSGAGGGGGAGVWGGGGGGEGDTDGNGGGGGAGLSSVSSDRATNGSYTRDTTGVPSITFTYDVPEQPGAVGGNGGGGGGNSPTLAPALSGLKAAPRTFAAASRGGSTGGTVGTTISYTSAVAGTTTFTVQAPRRGVTAAKCVKPQRGRHGKRCTRYVSLGSFTHTDVAGFNTFVFTGRVRHHKLAPGSYKLQAISSASGKKSRALTVSFRIAR
jgi:hypothetical protein